MGERHLGAQVGVSARPVPTVLLVDDSRGVREVLRILAEGRLDVVGEAENGREAIELAERTQPDAIILDNEMPEMTGLEALQALRRRAPRAVVVFYSAAPRSRMERVALEAGARAYFEKGETPRVVVEGVLALLSGGTV
jgi:two-component system, NarL family, nitrate/nitrite response regulator NarL